MATGASTRAKRQAVAQAHRQVACRLIVPGLECSTHTDQSISTNETESPVLSDKLLTKLRLKPTSRGPSRPPHTLNRGDVRREQRGCSMPTMAEVLRDKVALDSESVDRVYLNGSTIPRGCRLGVTA